MTPDDLARIGQGVNLVTPVMPHTRRDSANLTIQPHKESNMPTTNQAPKGRELTGPIVPFVAEYKSNHLELRRNGISLASYVQSAMRDDQPNYTMPTELRQVLDLFQDQHCGPVADPSRPLQGVY